MDPSVELERVKTAIGALPFCDDAFRCSSDDETCRGIAQGIVDRLRVSPGKITAINRMSKLPPDRRVNWAAQCWMNCITEMMRVDPELRASFQERDTYAPLDKQGQSVYIRAVRSHFNSFLYLAGWPAAEHQTEANFFLTRLVFLKHLILIENVESRLDGIPHGWGLLDAVIDTLTPMGSGGRIPIRTIATNSRVEAAFRRRGFVDAPLESAHHVRQGGYSCRLELRSS